MLYWTTNHDSKLLILNGFAEISTEFPRKITLAISWLKLKSQHIVDSQNYI